MTLNDIITKVKDFFNPSVASITGEFHKATVKLDALVAKLDAEMDRHQEAIAKHKVHIERKSAEADAAFIIASNIKELLNVKG